MPIRIVGITPGAAMLVVGAVVVAFMVRDAFVAAHQIVGWVVACSVFALLIDPLVDVLQRVLPRWLSIVVVVAATVAAFVGVFVGLSRELLDSLEELEVAAPRSAAQLEARYDWAADVDVSARVQAFVDGMHDSIRESTLQRALGTVPTYLVTGILMLFLLGYGRRYFLGFLKQFDDLDRRRTAREVVTIAAARGREYILLTMGYAVLSGVVFGLFCLASDLPAPLSLGFAVTVTGVVPLIGIFVGGVPAMLLAFGSQSWRVGAGTLMVLIALQSFEALVVRPRVDRRSVRVGPAIPIIIGLLAFEVYGVGGAIYAVALAVLGLAALDVYGGERDDADGDAKLVASGDPIAP